MKTISTLALLGWFAWLLAAEPADFLPPTSPWHGASEALIARPDHPWMTPAERMQLLDSPGYNDTIAYLKKLCAASPLLQLQPFGQTAQSRTLYLVVASREKVFMPAALRDGGQGQAPLRSPTLDVSTDGRPASLLDSHICSPTTSIDMDIHMA